MCFETFCLKQKDYFSYAGRSIEIRAAHPDLTCEPTRGPSNRHSRRRLNPSAPLLLASSQNIGLIRPTILLRHFFLCFLSNIGLLRLLCFLAILRLVLRLDIHRRWPPQPLGPERLLPSNPHWIHLAPNRSSCFCCFSFFSFSRLRHCCDDDLLIPSREIQVAIEVSSRQRCWDQFFHFTFSFVCFPSYFFLFAFSSLLFPFPFFSSNWLRLRLARVDICEPTSF